METPKVFDYRDYKTYLKDAFDPDGKTGRSGMRTAFAKALRCQPAYLSRVLNADAHLSLEQVERASRFLSHTTEEERFFFYLVLWNRAGTPSLRAKLGEELKEIKARQLHLKSRVALRQVLSADRQTTYYSAWYYAASHMLLDIDASWTVERVAGALGLSKKRTAEVLSFLVESGLVELTRTGYRIRERETHLATESPLVSKHHINWRLKAIQHLERGDGEAFDRSLNYSSVITVASDDIPKIREILLGAIEQVRKVVRATGPEEVLYSYCLDLFPVTHNLVSGNPPDLPH